MHFQKSEQMRFPVIRDNTYSGLMKVYWNDRVILMTAIAIRARHNFYLLLQIPINHVSDILYGKLKTDVEIQGN